MVPPGDFIPLAEETGLIVPLGRWVLLEACKQARFFQEMTVEVPPLSMSVNLSVKQLQQPDFTSTVAEILRMTGLDPATLILEITESVLMTDTDVTIERLNELKGLGIRLAVDDFGTGYSSLSYLSKFPVDILKIDRSFVSKLSTGEESELASAIVKLGEALNLETVAEGIELAAQMEHLSELGCSLGQGFYFAKPMDTDATLEFLRPVHVQEDSAPRGE
jgi:EAL domain-containing protein (putative c-di-GMP-specific phosphodiesterase class I)